MSHVEHLKSHEASRKANDLLHRPDLMNQLLGKTVTPIIIPPGCPTHLDWRNVHNVLSEIRDQGECGCSWSIAAVEAVEAQYRRYRGPLHLLSQQNLLDWCPRVKADPPDSVNYPYYLEDAYKWWCTGNNLVYSARDYPFVGYKRPNKIQLIHQPGPGLQPIHHQSGPGLHIYDYRSISAFDRELIMIHLNKYPLIARMEVYPSLIDLDANTIYEGPTYQDSVERINYNHLVLLVGYGTDHITEKNYWLVKNSWGRGWGDNGYGRMSRDIKLRGEFLLKNKMTFPMVVPDMALYGDRLYP